MLALRRQTALFFSPGSVVSGVAVSGGVLSARAVFGGAVEEFW